MRIYVEEVHQLNEQDLKDLVRGSETVTPNVLIAADYIFHNNDPNYDGGLSFLDRLYYKVSKFYELNWDIALLKQRIRMADQPDTEYTRVIYEILTRNYIACYGV